MFNCCKPFGRCVGNDENIQDPLLWSKDLLPHAFGEFSFATVQANSKMEDHSQVETGPHGTFVGMYDGHGGPEAAMFVNDHLFKYVLQYLPASQGGMSTDVLWKAFNSTEKAFSDVVDSVWPTMEHILAVGSCCLAAVVSGKNLYTANVGDSRVVLGTLRWTGSITANQLTAEHNANVEDVRRELKHLHPDDPHIVMIKNGSWRVRGIIQVSRSIGDFYLKRPELVKDHPLTWLPIQEPLKRPILTAEPSVTVHLLQPQDKFLVIATDGLWDSITNQEAVEIVHKYPHEGIAKRLIKLALHKTLKRHDMPYSELISHEGGVRRLFHDDISVVVLFIDADLSRRGSSLNVPSLSVKGGMHTVRKNQSTASDA